MSQHHRSAGFSRFRARLWVARSFVAASMMLPLDAGEPSPSPTEAALTFLHQLKNDPDKALAHSALTPETTRGKREEIKRRLKLLADSLNESELMPLDAKTDDILAAVLIAQPDDIEPERSRIHALAMVRKENAWRPAPVPGTFENSGITYLPGLAAKAQALEQWMALERSRWLANLQAEFRQTLLATIRAEIHADALMEAPPGQIVLSFLETCRHPGYPTALAFLGGIEDPPPDHFFDLARSLGPLLRQPSGRWAQLLARGSVYTVLHTEQNKQSALVSIGQFDPSLADPGESPVRVFHFSLKRSPDLAWRITLPDWLNDPSSPFDPHDPIDSELSDSVPERLFSDHPAKPAPSPDALTSSLIDALSSPDFSQILPLLSPPLDRGRVDTLTQLARLWREFQPGSPISPLTLATHTEGDHAVALVCHFDQRRPDIRPNLITRLVFHRAETGWLLDPPLGPQTPAPKGPLGDWLAAVEMLERDAWLARLLGQPALGALAPDAPAEKDARQIVKTWLDSASARRPASALTCAVPLDDKDAGDRLLRGLAQALADSSRTTILGTHRHGHWTAISVRHQPPDPDRPAHHLLYPVVTTPKGPRFVVEALLFDPDSRSREFLNAAIWKRLLNQFPAPAIDELRRLLEKHSKLVRQDTAPNP